MVFGVALDRDAASTPDAVDAHVRASAVLVNSR